MQKILIYLTLSLAAVLSGCAYQVEVQQGNVVTTQQVDRLTTGMQKSQVLRIMGAPLLQDPFHAERWDYYYSRSQGDELYARYHVTLHFNGERLLRVERKGKLPEKAYPVDEGL